MEDMSSFNRREVLKKSGLVSVSCLSGFTGISGASPGTPGDEEAPSTDFDPHDKEEVYQFAIKLSKLDKREAIAVLKQLSDAQKRAYAESMKPDKYEITIDSPVIETQTVSVSESDIQASSSNRSASSFNEPTTIHSGEVGINPDSGRSTGSGQSSVGTQDAGAYNFSISTTARNSVSGLLAYTYEVTTNYGWNDDHDELTELSSEATAADTGIPWRYRGESADMVSNNTGSGFVKQTGDFALCANVPMCVVISQNHPTISLKVYPDVCDYDILTRDNDFPDNG
jgi:hypothetical protein